MLNYYKSAHGVDIKDANQPLLESTFKNSKGKDQKIYLIPELCVMSGIDDSLIKNQKFMTELAKVTKFNPKGKIKF